MMDRQARTGCRLSAASALALILLTVSLTTAAFASESSKVPHELASDALADPERVVRLEARVAELERVLEAVQDRLDLKRLDSGCSPASSEIAGATAGPLADPAFPGAQADSAVISRPATAGGGSAQAETGDAIAASSVANASGRQDAEPTSSGATAAPRMPYGGYMEVHFNEDEDEPSTIDLHRFVLLFGHQFTDRIRFQGEVEIEHGLVEGGEESGELEIEQAYLDFSFGSGSSVRAGMMLTPMGIINERHEPATFNGVERPFVDTFVIPSTWFANGAGVVGRFGNGFSYKALVMSPLNAAFFSAEEGFRDGRQKGFFDNASSLAASLRLEYTGIRNLALGTSYWNGDTGFEFPDLSANAQMFELDARYRTGRFDFTGEYVTTQLDNTAQLNRALQRRTGIQPNIAEEMLGYYLESAVRLTPASARSRLVAFHRYELFNTQEKMAPGFLPLGEFNRSSNTIGLTYLPHPDVAVKLDYSFLDNESDFIEASDKWNLGLGWWF